MITCGWCHTGYAHWQPHCDNCGGPLPPLPGMDCGPAPPPVPRKLPRGFAFRIAWSRNFPVLASLFCGFVSSLMSYAMIKVGTFLAIVPLMFLFLAFALFRFGRTRAVGILHAFRRGIAVQGQVTQVRMDTTQSINERHPWKLKYRFDVGTQSHEGSLVSYDSTVGARGAGQPLWILYVEDNPDQCTPYPPMRECL